LGLRVVRERDRVRDRDRAVPVCGSNVAAGTVRLLAASPATATRGASVTPRSEVTRTGMNSSRSRFLATRSSFSSVVLPNDAAHATCSPPITFCLASVVVPVNPWSAKLIRAL